MLLFYAISTLFLPDEILWFWKVVKLEPKLCPHSPDELFPEYD